MTFSGSLLPVRRNWRSSDVEDGLVGGGKNRRRPYVRCGMVEGSALVLAKDGDAILLERAEGRRSLAELASDGKDDEASRIICSVRRKTPTPCESSHSMGFSLYPESVSRAWTTRCPICGDTAEVPPPLRMICSRPHETWWCSRRHSSRQHSGFSRAFLGSQSILKRLLGERGFDYANIFCNSP